MTTLIVFLCIALLLLIIVQIARVRDLAKQLRGKEEVEATAVASTGRGLLLFAVVFLLATAVSALYYKNWMLGFGPLESASIHGASIDSMMKWTLAITYVAFFITNAVLFYFAYKYRTRKNHKALYLSHNNTVELIWTGIPAIVMTFLVVGGLDVWNDTMSDVGADDQYMEIEATGYQFAWQMRYPGPDGLLGRKDFRLISGANPLGQDWTDPKNHDDILVNDVTLPVDQKVRVRITAKDVLHDFYLPQFRVKMDAVPGLPTYFVFTPTKTTREWRKELSAYPEYQVPDPESDDGEQLWENRNFELACAELCGKGHYSMARVVTILEQEDFDIWYAGQKSYYEENVKGTKDDPIYMAEIQQRRGDLLEAADNALSTPSAQDNTIDLEAIRFESESTEPTEFSTYQLNDLIVLMEQHPEVRIELTVDSDTENGATELARSRAEAVRNYLVASGGDQDRMRILAGDDQGENEGTEDAQARNQVLVFNIIQGDVNEPAAAAAPESDTEQEESSAE